MKTAKIDDDVSDEDTEAGDDTKQLIALSSDDESVDPKTSKVKAACPPALKDWIEKKKKGHNPPWANNCATAVGDWMRSFKTHGHPDIAATIKDSKGENRKDIMCRLYLCKKVADLDAMQEEIGSKKDKIKHVKGWMNAYQIMDRKKVPITAETKTWRDQFLSTLDWRDDSSYPDGYVYWYEEMGPQESIASREKKVTLGAKKQKLTEDEWNQSLVVMDEDANKWKQKYGFRKDSSSPAKAIIDKGRGKGKDKTGKRQKPKMNIEELDLGEQEKQLANAMMKKNAWQQGMRKNLKKIIVAIDEKPVMVKKVQHVRNKVGNVIVKEFNGALQTMETIKDTANKQYCPERELKRNLFMSLLVAAGIPGFLGRYSSNEPEKPMNYFEAPAN